MNRAEVCIPRILEHEGGYVNHPNDPGGPTNKGITLATYRTYINQRGTIDDLKNLTVEQATRVYKARYWDAVKADQLPHGVDYAVADFAVNSGPARAARYLQSVVGEAQDGVVGPKTIFAVWEKRPSVVITTLCDKRMDFLRGLSTWPTFGKGWSARVARVRAGALADAAGGVSNTPSTPNAEPSWLSAIMGVIKSILEMFKR